MSATTGPLAGVRVLELSAIGPLPHAGMVLADLGADVVRIERPAGGQLQLIAADWPDPVLRGRRRIEVDLSDPAGPALVRRLAAAADVFLEGFRPGVAERLGLGPSELTAANERLVYGRMSGWGRTGPLAATAGHDINYVGLTGLLHAIGPAERPIPPLNMLGDYGGGSMVLVIGVLAALHERSTSDRGQVVDCSILDGAAALGSAIWSMIEAGVWREQRAANVLDGGAPFYRTYMCRDGGFVAVGALEDRFYAKLVDGLGLDSATLPDRRDRTRWDELARRFADVFARRSRDEWAEVFAGTDACVTPVLTYAEAAAHPQVQQAGTYVTVDGVRQAAAVPTFSRSVTKAAAAPSPPGPADAMTAEWERAAGLNVDA